MEKSFEFAENIVGFMVNGEIDEKKINEILNALKEKIEKITPICFYLEDQSNEGISFKAFMETLTFHFTHSKDFEKVAIVTDDKIFQKSMELKDFFLASKVKTFARKERLKALNWVME